MRIYGLFFILVSIGLLTYGCSDDNGEEPDTLSINITRPAEEDTVSGVLIVEVSVEPSAEFVEFRFDTCNVVSDSTVPFEADFNISFYETGQYAVSAIAHKDNDTAEESVSFYIEEAGSLWLMLIQPTEDDSAFGLLRVAASAGFHPEYVEFYFDTFTVFADSSEPYEALYDILLYPFNTYSISALAYLGAGTYGDTIVFKVEPPPNQYFQVLVEDFTNTDCVPCVNVDEALGNVREQYDSQEESAVFVEFHPQIYPNDPFRSAAPELHDGRGEYYEISSVPQLFVDGTVMTNAEATDPDVVYSKIQTARTTSKSGTVIAAAYIFGDTISLYAYIDATEGLSGKLFCYLTRRLTEFAVAPGANGITEFHYTAAAAFNDIAGECVEISAGNKYAIRYCLTIPDDIAGGETQEYTAIIIVQDETTHQVIAAAAVDVE